MKPPFNADAAEEYFTGLLVSYLNTANDIFLRDNEGRGIADQTYSAEYQKFIGMQIALREVLDYFGKYDLGEPAVDMEPVRHGEWIDVNITALLPGVPWVCRCSLCGCPQDYKHTYCPNCGAKMDKNRKVNAIAKA